MGMENKNRPIYQTEWFISTGRNLQIDCYNLASAKRAIRQYTQGQIVQRVGEHQFPRYILTNNRIVAL
jgi:hypothetical protein